MVPHFQRQAGAEADYLQNAVHESCQSHGLDLQHRYKLLGKLIHANGEYLLAFDLTSTEIYQRSTEEGSSSISRIASYSEEWKDQFGMPFYEHQKSMKISTFDGYAVYAIKEGGAKSVKQVSAETEAME